jgi:hypothetical protein
MCWVCVTQQITSRRLGSSKFISHSLLHLHNLQFHNYCHLQYHNYFSAIVTSMHSIQLNLVTARLPLPQMLQILTSFSGPFISTPFLCIPVSLKYPQSDSGKPTSLHCCIKTVFTGTDGQCCQQLFIAA